jgi:hypothetical protein
VLSSTVPFIAFPNAAILPTVPNLPNIVRSSDLFVRIDNLSRLVENEKEDQTSKLKSLRFHSREAQVNTSLNRGSDVSTNP